MQLRAHPFQEIAGGNNYGIARCTKESLLWESGMTVDDEYVIVGSANINQRSMAGSKDTEIAMGSYEPHHTWAAKKRHPYGHNVIVGRTAWSTRLCLGGDRNSKMKRYTNEKHTTLQGHLLRYPLQVDADGNVNSLPGFDNFPDVGGKVMGAHSPSMPDILTT
ncbi:C2 domain-containing protein [Tanacetum coccineum]